jgi:hypothetical protein
LPVTLVRVNESESGGDFVLLSLRTVSRVGCRGFFDGEQHRHRATVFTSGGSVQLFGADADGVISALEDLADHPNR